MSLAYYLLAKYEPIRSLPAASILAMAYTEIGDPFENPSRIFKITNLTDAALFISFDGVTDHDIVGANSFTLYDYCSDRSEQGGTLEQAAGTQVWVREESTPATTGTVYVTTIYASNNI